MKETLYTEPGTIRTYTGQYINVFDPQPEQIHLEDIAHALSLTCRWGSHTPHFYSVAQHSLNVGHHLAGQGYPAEIILEGLLHDAAEAYLLDLPSPIKVLLPDYRKLEQQLLRVIYKKFHLVKEPLSPAVKAADRWWLEKEWKELVVGTSDDFRPEIPGVSKQYILQAIEHQYASMREARRMGATV